MHPFHSAGESVMLLFRPLLSAPKPYNQPVVVSTSWQPMVICSRKARQGSMFQDLQHSHKSSWNTWTCISVN